MHAAVGILSVGVEILEILNVFHEAVPKGTAHFPKTVFFFFFSP